MEFPQTLSPVVLEKYSRELNNELEDILIYWLQNSLDRKKGGFYGAVGMNNKPDLMASKGVVLNSRILWTFSAAALAGMEEYEAVADRAYTYIEEKFRDKKYGGVYWSVSSQGQPLEEKKQIYGLAFCIYGLAEYFKLTKKPAVLNFAIELYALIEKYSYDQENGGYIEAFSREWKELDDLRLSEKDENEQKTMNTHLHIIEAYANLYSVWKNEKLKQKIKDLLSIFQKKIIDNKSGHLHLFMSESWEVKSKTWSFGHDIEASWLLLECAYTIDDLDDIIYFEKKALELAEAAVEGSDKDGALFHEVNYAKDILLKEKHWWQQAEAMVGFFNAWEITQDDMWLSKSVQVWEYVKNNLKDAEFGEWYWGLDENNQIMSEDKIGFWKCPYHNARACLEILKRLKRTIKVT
ncbi:MAG: AGE family epimerase/isomerase [Ginsengibacter sp.]